MTRSLALIIFIIVYILFVAFPRRRAAFAVAATVLLLLLRIVGVGNAFFELVNWNVMAIFCGTLVVAELFTRSKVPAYLADKIVERCKNAGMALLGICLLTSFLSAFVENVAAVLIIAPVAFAVCKKMEVSPVTCIIGLAVSSNLQGTATLIGDPPSMILASYSRMTFIDFFWYNGRPSIFFAVQVGALTSLLVLHLFFRGYRQRVQIEEIEEVSSWVPTYMLATMVCALAVSSFIDPGFNYLAGTICAVYGVAGVIWHKVASKGGTRELLKSLDWETAIFLGCIFIVVGSLTETGWVDDLSGLLERLTGTSVFASFSTLVWASVLLSAFIDNVPYLMTMVHVAGNMAQALGTSRELLLFGLLIGACVGGNISPVGAAANVVATGLLRSRGHHVSLWRFVRIGLPFTIAATLASYIFLWLVWA